MSVEGVDGALIATVFVESILFLIVMSASRLIAVPF
jgi:hypothetical protein